MIYNRSELTVLICENKPIKDHISLFMRTLITCDNNDILALANIVFDGRVQYINSHWIRKYWPFTYVRDYNKNALFEINWDTLH